MRVSSVIVGVAGIGMRMSRINVNVILHHGFLHNQYIGKISSAEELSRVGQIWSAFFQKFN